MLRSEGVSARREEKCGHARMHRHVFRTAYKSDDAERKSARIFSCNHAGTKKGVQGVRKSAGMLACTGTFSERLIKGELP